MEWNFKIAVNGNTLVVQVPRNCTVQKSTVFDYAYIVRNPSLILGKVSDRGRQVSSHNKGK